MDDTTAHLPETNGETLSAYRKVEDRLASELERLALTPQELAQRLGIPCPEGAQVSDLIQTEATRIAHNSEGETGDWRDCLDVTINAPASTLEHMLRGEQFLTLHEREAALERLHRSATQIEHDIKTTTGNTERFEQVFHGFPMKMLGYLTVRRAVERLFRMELVNRHTGTKVVDRNGVEHEMEIDDFYPLPPEDDPEGKGKEGKFIYGSTGTGENTRTATAKYGNIQLHIDVGHIDGRNILLLLGDSSEEAYEAFTRQGDHGLSKDPTIFTDDKTIAVLEEEEGDFLRNIVISPSEIVSVVAALNIIARYNSAVEEQAREAGRRVNERDLIDIGIPYVETAIFVDEPLTLDNATKITVTISSREEYEELRSTGILQQLASSSRLREKTEIILSDNLELSDDERSQFSELRVKNKQRHATISDNTTVLGNQAA